MFLSRSARHVHVLVRGNSLAASMSSDLIGRLTRDPGITLRPRSPDWKARAHCLP